MPRRYHRTPSDDIVINPRAWVASLLGMETGPDRCCSMALGKSWDPAGGGLSRRGAADLADVKVRARSPGPDYLSGPTLGLIGPLSRTASLTTLATSPGGTRRSYMKPGVVPEPGSAMPAGNQCPRPPGASASEHEHLGGRVTGGSRLRSSQGTREHGLDVGRGWGPAPPDGPGAAAEVPRSESYARD